MAKMNYLFHDDADIEEMRVATGRDTKGDVVRDALTVYKELIKLAQQDGEIIYRHKNGKERGVTITTLEAARKIAKQKASKRLKLVK